MKDNNFHKTITINVSADEAFKKIVNVGEWWLTSFKGRAEKLNDVFTVIVGDHGNLRFKIVEAVPNKKIVWLVTDCFLSLLKDKAEWKNTHIVFEITDVEGKTKLDFTHIGLVPGIECYSDCVWGWNHYIGKSLPKLLETGKGIPYEGPYEDEGGSPKVSDEMNHQEE